MKRRRKDENHSGRRFTWQDYSIEGHIAPAAIGDSDKVLAEIDSLHPLESGFCNSFDTIRNNLAGPAFNNN
ncbi:hypothetical protein [Pseudomonas sp. NPDC089569]|uniref:hypothetical protein n=1 Tax=Pseudomonas sp. NPDC089569 TaxID=3390722 RepID=UPI003D027752